MSNNPLTDFFNNTPNSGCLGGAKAIVWIALLVLLLIIIGIAKIMSFF